MLAAAVLLPLLLAPGYPWVLLVLLLIPACVPPSRVMLTGSRRESLIPVLKRTGLINLAFSLLFGLGIVLSAALG